MTSPFAFTFTDLFAGIGGIRPGFEAAGGHCVYTSEWDDYARKTYAANFPDDHEIAGDITRIDGDRCGAFFLFAEPKIEGVRKQ